MTHDTVYIEKLMPCFYPMQARSRMKGYATTPNYSVDIIRVPALGGTSRKFISGAGLPIWSPDGSKIAFFRTFIYLRLWVFSSQR